MAEIIVSFAIDKLVQFVNTEVELLGNLPAEIKSISNELQTIKAILKDAEKQAEDDDSIKEWLRQVREIAYQIEDIADDYLLLKQQQNHARRRLNRVFQHFGQAKPKHELATTIKRIKEEIAEINSRRDRYRFITTERAQQVNDGNWQDICSLYVDDSELVGIEGPKTEVIGLMEQGPLVAIVGMGGLGKSTLARKVYHQTRRCFHINAWITVSQYYSVVDLLKSVYKQFLDTAQEDFDWVQIDDRLRDLTSITEELRTYLGKAENSYLVVFDDIWGEGPIKTLINCTIAALPANNVGSRILVTTRDEDIATPWITQFKGSVYRLKSLPTDAAWSLFSKKTFGNEDCPAELKKFADDFVKTCDGLPLVLVAVGGLLSTKRSDYSEWRKLRDTLGLEFLQNRHLQSSTRILLLSYQELPYHLKPCFLYFGLFPEGYSIDCMRLIRLWIAEGFIESCRGKTLEEVALEYVTALVKRNLVQVSRRDVTGRCRSFRVHDVLREIILSKLEEAGFSQVMAKDSFLRNTHFRRLSIHYSFDKSIKLCSTACNIRTILVFDNQHMSSFLTSSQPSLFRFLKVLDLQDAAICVIPTEVGGLHNLQLLSLRNTNVETLPKSIGHLWNLQTLDLKRSKVSNIPSEAKCLSKLRHLLGYCYLKWTLVLHPVAIEIPAGVLENFLELQKLAFINGSQNRLLLELRNLKQLTRLGITGLTEENGADLCYAIEKMKHLRSLTVLSKADDAVLNLGHLARPPSSLERLYLSGTLEKLPDWIPKLNNLAKLALRYSRLDNDPVEKLQGLANLVQLDLCQAYTGQKLDFGQNGFQKLMALHLSGFDNLRTIEGSLPALQHLRHDSCPELVEVPPHMNHYLSSRVRLGGSIQDPLLIT